MRVKVTVLVLTVFVLACSAVIREPTNVITVRPAIGDDTATIQAAFDRLTDGLANTNPAMLRFEPGVYEVRGVLDLKDKYRAVVDGQTAVLTGDFSINVSGSYIDIHNLYLRSDADTPAIIYGRNANGTGGNFRLHNVQVHTNNDIGAVLWGQADSSACYECEIWNGGNAPSVILTSENETGLLDYPASTETFVRFVGGWIHGNGDVLVSMRGLVQNVTFDTVFFSPAEHGTAAVELTSGQAHGVSFRNSRTEGFTDAVLLRTLPNTILAGVDFDQYIHAAYNASFVLDIRGTAGQVDKDYISLSNSQTQIADVTGSLVWTGDENKQPEVRTVDSYFSYAAPVLLLDNANLTHLAPMEDYQQVVIVFDGNSTIGGGYFIGLPEEPYKGKAGEVMELISLYTWYWTVK